MGKYIDADMNIKVAAASCIIEILDRAVAGGAKEITKAMPEYVEIDTHLKRYDEAYMENSHHYSPIGYAIETVTVAKLIWKEPFKAARELRLGLRENEQYIKEEAERREKR